MSPTLLREFEHKLNIQIIFRERKKLFDALIFNGKTYYQNRKQYLKMMSAQKFNINN
jgi:hypothetical protein